MAEHSPTPWRVADIEHDYDILDADGKVAARAAHGNMELAALIVEAVNERDRLRDLVRRMLPSVEAALALSETEGEALDRWLDLIREAREAVGEGGEK